MEYMHNRFAGRSYLFVQGYLWTGDSWGTRKVVGWFLSITPPPTIKLVRDSVKLTVV